VFSPHRYPPTALWTPSASARAVGEVADPYSCSEPSNVAAGACSSARSSPAAQAVSPQMACRILGVSESGLHAWRGRSLSARSVRHVWLTDLIQQVHAASRGVYGPS
jgi:hypothetical protein